jgi:hypothetical protein
MFDLHVAVLWCIHDYPALSTLSGRITKGYFACTHCEKHPLCYGLRSKIGYFGHYPMRSGGLRTKPSKPTGQSAYFLVYGSKAILLVDVIWDSPAVEQYDEGISEDSRRVDIDGLEEARCATLVQSARYLKGI